VKQKARNKLDSTGPIAQPKGLASTPAGGWGTDCQMLRAEGIFTKKSLKEEFLVHRLAKWLGGAPMKGARRGLG